MAHLFTPSLLHNVSYQSFYGFLNSERGAQYLLGENLKVACAKFSTLSLGVLLYFNESA